MRIINMTKLLCHEEMYTTFVIRIDYGGDKSVLLYYSTNGESWSKSVLPNVTLEYLHRLDDFRRGDIYDDQLVIYDHSAEPGSKIVDVIKTSPSRARFDHPSHRAKLLCFLKD